MSTDGEQEPRTLDEWREAFLRIQQERDASVATIEKLDKKNKTLERSTDRMEACMMEQIERREEVERRYASLERDNEGLKRERIEWREEAEQRIASLVCDNEAQAQEIEALRRERASFIASLPPRAELEAYPRTFSRYLAASRAEVAAEGADALRIQAGLLTGARMADSALALLRATSSAAGGAVAAAAGGEAAGADGPAGAEGGQAAPISPTARAGPAAALPTAEQEPSSSQEDDAFTPGFHSASFRSSSSSEEDADPLHLAAAPPPPAPPAMQRPQQAAVPAGALRAVAAVAAEVQVQQAGLVMPAARQQMPSPQQPAPQQQTPAAQQQPVGLLPPAAQQQPVGLHAPADQQPQQEQPQPVSMPALPPGGWQQLASQTGETDQEDLDKLALMLQAVAELRASQQVFLAQYKPKALPWVWWRQAKSFAKMKGVQTQVQGRVWQLQEPNPLFFSERGIQNFATSYRNIIADVLESWWP